MEGNEICRDPEHHGAFYSHRYLAYLCPHLHEDGRTYYARLYDR